MCSQFSINVCVCMFQVTALISIEDTKLTGQREYHGLSSSTKEGLKYIYLMDFQLGTEMQIKQHRANNIGFP